MIDELRRAARALGRQPGFTLVTLATLALGIAANAAVFSVMNAVLLRPLPYEKAGRLVMIWGSVPRMGIARGLASPPEYQDWQREERLFASVSAYTEAFFNLGPEGGAPERLPAMLVTTDFFDTLGVRPSVGRGFRHGDAGGETDLPILISHGLWQRRFGADPAVVGGSLMLGAGQFHVAGVLPSDFFFSPKKVDAFVPLAFSPEQLTSWRGRNYLTVVARLQRGVDARQAQAGLDRLAARLAQDHPATHTGRETRVVPMEDEVVGGARGVLLPLQGAVALVLLIAAANVASLQLARGLARSRELATRAALGATRARLVAPLVAESLILSLGGGAIGVALAQAGTRLIVAMSPPDVPRIAEAGLDLRVLAFTFATAAVSGVLSGLWPAFQVSRGDLHGSLQEGGRSASGGLRSRARRVLVTAELALSFILLVGAGLLIKSFVRLQEVDPGLRPEGALAVDLSMARGSADPRSHARFFEQILERVAAIPGVRAAGVVDNLPLSGEDARRRFTIVGDTTPSTEKPSAEHRRISTRYFEAMGMRLVRGRAATAADSEPAPSVAVVNEAFVRTFLAGRDPLGAQIVVEDGAKVARAIVGVVADVRHFGLDKRAEPEMYVLHVDRPWPHMTLVVRTETQALGLLPAIRREVAALDSALPLANVKTLEQYLSASTAPRRFSMRLAGGFAALALLLALVGLHGLLAFTVAQRTPEIGLRLALGARTSDIVRGVLGDGARMVGVGLTLGVAGGWAASRLLSGLLYEVAPAGPAVFAAAALVVAAAALFAMAGAAALARRVDPIVCLRSISR